ncbi:MAG: 1-acyl-sn-glycerol-3-phosphate acyltransferase, partial [Mesorhizobium sp.]
MTKLHIRANTFTLLQTITSVGLSA